ncbi:MAG: hypothetical protein ACRDD2_10815 [Sarcina sp.]
MKKKEIGKIYILWIFIAALIVFVFYSYATQIIEAKKVDENNKIIYNNDGLVMVKFNTKVEDIEVKGNNEDIIEDYLEGILDSTYTPIGLKVSYDKVPTIERLNSVVKEEGIKTVSKPLADSYNTIFTIIENSSNPEGNCEVIEKLLQSPSNMALYTEGQIDGQLAKTTIKGEQLNQLKTALNNMKNYYLKGFNTTPV